MAINLSGMFTNLGAATSALGESVKGPALPQDPRDRNAMQRAGITNPMLQMFGQGLGSAFGGDMRSAQQQSTGVMGSAMTSGSWQQQMEAAKKLLDLGMTEQGAALFKLAQEGKAKEEARLREQQQREAIASKATSLGLTGAADLALNGGDLKEVQKEILAEERRLMLNKGGKPARIQMAINAGLPELARDIRDNKYNTVSDEEFQALLDGSKADLKVFDDGTGEPRPFRVNEFGKVYDPNTGKWVNPSDLGLTAAPQLTKDVSDQQAFNSKLTDAQADDVTKGLALAQDAREVLDNGATLEALLDQGILSGSFANTQRELYSAAAKLNVLPQEELVKLENTEAYLSAVGKAVAKEIKAFGAGTGLSDKDREFAENIAGGKITVTEGALKRILRIRKKAARNQISRYLDTVDRLHSNGTMNTQHYEYYRGPFDSMDLSDESDDAGNLMDTQQPQATQIGRFKVTVGG